MSIINHFYRKIINNSIKNALSKEIDLLNVENYVDLINCLDGFMSSVIKEAIRKSFEEIDIKFKNSHRRKELYYTKGKYPRTIMTLFGEITYEREYYVLKGMDRDGMFYVDQLFNLPKRDYYDPMIKALIIEKSAEYSYTQSGKLIGDTIGKRFKNLSEERLSQISRQTVRNIILKADMDYTCEEPKEDVETIYIQLDEKWIYTQGNKGKMVEIKAAVVYTDIEEEYNKRNRLVDRHILTSIQSATDLKEKLLDYINATYNVDKIKNVIVSGDGANWIKHSTPYFVFNTGMFIRFILDRFHMNQAINHISKDEEIKKYLREYLTFYHATNFKKLCDTLILENPHREEIIAKNRDYIISNWKFIKNQSHPLFKGCSMEGHISHVLAALFTSRPKAHSLVMIPKRLHIRTLYANNVDLKQVYLTNHIDPLPLIDYVELSTDYPATIQDTIGHKVNSKYLWYKEVTHSTIFS